MGKQPACIQIDGMTPRWFDDRDPGFQQAIPQESCLPEAVGKIGFIQPLPKPDRQCFQIATCKTPVGGKPLTQNQLVAYSLVKVCIAHRQESTDIHQRIFFCAHPGAIGQGENFANDLWNGFGFIRFFSFV